MDAILDEFRALQRIDSSPVWIQKLIDSSFVSTLRAMASVATLDLIPIATKSRNARWAAQAMQLQAMAVKYPDDLVLLFTQSTLNPHEKAYLFSVVFQSGFNHSAELKRRVLEIESLPKEIKRQHRGWAE